MSKHPEVNILRKRVFDVVRDYPDLSSSEITQLLDIPQEEGGVTTYLTQLFDANLVTRYKKTIANEPGALHATRTVYHYATTVAEYRWERKKRTPGPRKDRPQAPTQLVPVRTEPPQKHVAFGPVAVASPTPAPASRGWQDKVTDPVHDPVKAVLSQIENMRYGDVKRLKAEIDGMFAGALQ